MRIGIEVMRIGIKVMRIGIEVMRIGIEVMRIGISKNRQNGLFLLKIDLITPKRDIKCPKLMRIGIFDADWHQIAIFLIKKLFLRAK